MELAFVFQDDFAGEGVSSGLPRGLLVELDGENLTQEGMGLGLPVLQWRGLNYFPVITSSKNVSSTQFERTYSFEKCLYWYFGSRKLTHLTRVFEFCTQTFYMPFPIVQPAIFKITQALRKHLPTTVMFDQVEPIGQCTVKYDIIGNQVLIEQVLQLFTVISPKVILLNELGADYFAKSHQDGVISGPPSGWVPIPTANLCPELINETHGLSFRISEVQEQVAYQLKWGREKAADYCWSGFEIEYKMKSGLPANFAYKINFEFQE